MASKLFSNCIKPLSKLKTVILVTHQINYLYECDQLLVLQEGAIVEKGTPKELNRVLA